MPRSLKIENYGSDKCAKCEKTTDNAIALLYDEEVTNDKVETLVFVFCEECLTDAIGSASEEEESTEMLTRG